MIKNNKIKAIMSSLLTLLPALFGIILWDKLPDTMFIHWGMDGNADGTSNKAFCVFGLPIIILILHWVCLIATSFDKNQKNQNKKALGMIFWIVPFISLFVNTLMYSVAFGKEFNPLFLMPLILGVPFVIMGNYLPKVKQNSTFGVKVYWTLNNEENWDKTHRFAGKIWFFGGLILIASVLLPDKIIIPIASVIIMTLVIAPIIYSYTIYKKHIKAGISYKSAPKSKGEKIVAVISLIIITLIVIAASVLMFTGDVEYQVKDNTLKIEADYWSDLQIDCDKIENAEYRDTFDKGTRTNGLGSARLSLGNFRNDEFSDYTLYSYNQNDSCVVMRVDGKTLVVNGKTADETKELYNLIMAQK